MVVQKLKLYCMFHGDEYINTLPYCNMQGSDTGIDTIVNVLIHHVSQYNLMY